MAARAFLRGIAVNLRSCAPPLVVAGITAGSTSLWCASDPTCATPSVDTHSARIPGAVCAVSTPADNSAGPPSKDGMDDPTALPPKELRYFRRKTESFPPGEKFLMATVCGILGNVSKFVMDVLNHTTYYHRDKLLKALATREEGQGVLTVCNHVSAVDDPGAVAVLLPQYWLWQPTLVRWTLCAKDRCFKNPFVGAFLSKGKVLPIHRGKGIDQDLMNDVVKKLDTGDWVHMFPEGTRSRNGDLGRMRLGVAKLIEEAKKPPVVVPFYHRGMEHILGVGQWIPVNVGQQLTILVGDPIRFDDILEEYRAGGMTRREMHIKVVTRIGDALRALRDELDSIHEARPEIAPADSVFSAKQRKAREALRAAEAKQEQ